jgi:hypothetical protein
MAAKSLSGLVHSIEVGLLMHHPRDINTDGPALALEMRLGSPQAIVESRGYSRSSTDLNFLKATRGTPT